MSMKIPLLMVPPTILTKDKAFLERFNKIREGDIQWEPVLLLPDDAIVVMTENPEEYEPSVL